MQRRRQSVPADGVHRRCNNGSNDMGHDGLVGHAGNGDAMLAYHLMDFSRYFFDQSDISR